MTDWGPEELAEREADRAEAEQVLLGSDIRWQFYPSKQYPDLFEIAGTDPFGEIYYAVSTPCGRVCLRKK